MHNRTRGWCHQLLLVGTCTIASVASAATFRPAQLVRDIETTLIPASSHPRIVCARDSNTTFFTMDEQYRVKLWRTNGTLASTALVQDFGVLDPYSDVLCLHAGTNGQQFVLLITGNGVSLLAIDAAATGTVEVLRSTDGNWPALLGMASRPVFSISQADGSTRLVASDGTVAGTAQIGVVPAAGGGFPALVIKSSLEMNGRVYFGAGGSLWETDGTSAGTHLAVALPAAPAPDPYLQYFERLGGGFLFVRQSGDISELWFSDGLGQGTRLLATFGADQDPRGVQDVTGMGNGLAIFTVRDFSGNGNGQLWRTNGLAAGTVRINAPPDLEVTDVMQPLRGGGAIFKGLTATYGREPWFTDGTDAGTRLLKDFAPGPDESYLLLQAAGQGALLINTQGSTYDLWYTDGTLTGTWSLSAVEPRLAVLGTNFMPFIALGTRYLFLTFVPGSGSYDFTLWRLDPAARSVTAVRQFQAPQDSGVLSSIAYAAPFRGLGLLATYDPVTGYEPWVTDGTPTGTTPIGDLEPQVSNQSSAASPAFSLDGVELFSAYTIAQGYGLWRTDGTAAGTAFVANAAPVFGTTGVPTVRRSGSIFYPAREPSGEVGLWRTDGTASGTARVQTFGVPGVGGFSSDGPAGCGIGFASLGNTFYFGVRVQSLGRLYRSDGTPGGTVELGMFPGPSGFGATVCPLASFGNELYFTATEAATGVTILWRTNGLAGGQARILTPSNSTFQNVVAMRQAGAALYFTAVVDGTYGLWRIAGQGAQPSLVRQYPGTGIASVTPNGWIEALDSVVVYPLCNNSGCRLARSDGTAAGTFELTAPYVPFFFQPWAYLLYGGKLLFQGGDASGFEPWITDGSLAGTRLLKDVVPGLDSSKARDFIDFNGLAYFQFDVTQNGVTSSQLWRTDGTEAGTEQVNATPAIGGTLQSGLFPQISTPPFGVAGDRLYFRGSTLATGAELYVIENEAPLAAADVATTPAGTAITVSVLGNDSDPDGALVSSSLRIAQAPGNGAATVDAAAGVIRYTPNNGFSGTDSFTYQVADRQGRFSAPASVNVTVVAATVSGGGGGTSGSGGSGGGGPLGLLSLLGMGAWIAMRTACRGTGVAGAARI